MPTNTSRASYDTHIAEEFPNENRGDYRQLNLRGTAGIQRLAFVYCGGIAPAGSTVISATLKVYLKGTGWSGGPHTITAKRVTASWKESTLTWTRSGAGQMASATNAGSAQVTGGVQNQAVSIDVSLMLADIAAGTPWYGIRLEVTGGLKELWPTEAPDPDHRPLLTVNWAKPPLAPVDMAPSGGRVVNGNKPVLTWDFRDAEGDQQTELAVEIASTPEVDSDGSFTFPDFSSGFIVSSNEQLDLNTTAYAGVPAGATRYWIVRVKDTNGLTSPWSKVASFARVGKGTLTINSPTNGGTVQETTPAISTTLSTLAQEAIEYVLEEEDSNGNFVTVWTKARFAASAAAGVPFVFNVPSGIIKLTGRDYRLTVRSWDNADREATPGDAPYVQAVATFTFIRSATPAPVTTLSVIAADPGIQVTFNRAVGQVNPDWFCLMIDGVRVMDRIDPADFSQGGSPIVYQFIYYGTVSSQSHTFEVEAVVNDAGILKHSQSNATQVFNASSSFILDGIWLIDDQDPPHDPSIPTRKVRIRSTDPPDLTIGESSATFFPIGRRDPVRVVDSVRGLEGTVSGQIWGGDPAGSDFIENFKWMKAPEQVGRRFRLTFGTENFAVELGEAQLSQTGETVERLYVVSVEVAQVGGF